MSERADLIRDYFRRQYETVEGTVAENVLGLFAHDLVYHLTGDRAMGRDELIALTDLLRRSRQDRVTSVSDFTEEGDDVSFLMTIGSADDDTQSVASRTTYRFRDDKVVDVWQEDSTNLEVIVRAAGISLAG